jgi:hypothetical protein
MGSKETGNRVKKDRQKGGSIERQARGVKRQTRSCIITAKVLDKKMQKGCKKTGKRVQ